MVDPLAIDPEPAGSFSFVQMLPTLVFDVATPIIVFNLLSRCGVPSLWALVAGGLSPAINNLRIWVRSRRLEPLGIIVITLLAIGTAASLISGRRILRADQGIVSDRDLRFHLSQLATRRAASDVLHQPTVRRRRRSGAAQMVERALGVSRLSSRATLRDRGVGNSLSHRSPSQGWLCAGPLTGAGSGDFAGDGIWRDDRARRMDATIFACFA